MTSAQKPVSFEDFSTYYDLFYQDKNYLAEAKYVIQIINTYSTAAKELLELGCGTGNYSKHFSNAGFRITGIEKSRKMAELANSKSIPGFSSVVDDITCFKINKTFDATVSLFHVISYLTDNKSLLACLKQVHEHLTENGIFIFDVWYTPAVYYQQPKNTVKQINTTNCKITRRAKPLINYEKNIVEVNYELIIKNNITGENKILNETHLMRHFSTPEIKLMAELSGFKLLHSEEFLTAKPPCADTWGVCYILQKND